MVLFFIYLLCSIGGIWHAYHILHLVISGELVSTRFYELMEQIEMPEISFCFEIDEILIDRNQKLTGAYLEELTSELTSRRIFRDIFYLNELNKWIPFDINQVERFFFLNMKCFKLEIDQVYYRNQFHFLNKVLKINLKKKSEINKQVYFMTKSKETKEFSKIF